LAELLFPSFFLAPVINDLYFFFFHTEIITLPIAHLSTNLLLVSLTSALLIIVLVLLNVGIHSFYIFIAALIVSAVELSLA